MREFPQESLLSALLARGDLAAVHIDALASRIATFHGMIAVAGMNAPVSRPEDVRRLAMANFSETRPLVENMTDNLASLSLWTQREHTARANVMAHRLRDGFVRECHGDLHTGNIALVDGQITIFDCLEFNDNMRWMDTMSEVAFVVMDLQDRRKPDLAARFLNACLEMTGDYAGMRVLPFYLA